MAKKSDKMQNIQDGITANLIKELTMTPEQAQAAAHVAVLTLVEQWQGDVLYVPKGFAITIEKRDWDIWHEFTGANHAELAKKYDMTVRQIYKRIEVIRPLAIAKVQPGLFSE